MTDDLKQISPQQENLPTPQVEAPLPAPSKKSNKKIWIILGAVITVLLIVCVAVFGIILSRMNTEQASIEPVLDAYMRHMANKDAESAYALFSPTYQRQRPISNIQEMLDGNNYLVFEGYLSLSVSNIRISVGSNPNPDNPLGPVATVTGVINYEGSIQGSFTGTLEKVGDKWMIDAINVTVPINKIK